MAPVKRWLARLLGIGVLIAAGWFALDYAKSRPRCVIVSDAHAIHFSDDGNTVITGYTGCQIGNQRQGGVGKPPVTVWDTRKGKIVRTVMADAGQFKSYGICVPHCLLAAAVDEKRLRVANWESGAEWSIDIDGEPDGYRFAPSGDWLALRFAKSNALALIDLERREITHRVPSDGYAWDFEPDGSRWYYVAGRRLHAWNTATSAVEASIGVKEGLLRLFHEEPYFAYRSGNDLSLVICDRLAMKPVSRVRPNFTPAGADAWEAFHACEATFSSTGKHMATLPNGAGRALGMLEIWEVKTGRRLASIPQLKKGWTWFLGDEILICFHRTPQGSPNTFNDRVTAVDIATGKVLWERTGELGRFFTFDPATGVQIEPEGTWQFFDPTSGEPQASLPHPFAHDRLMTSFDDAKRLVWSVGRRRSIELPPAWKERLARWVTTESDCVQVVDVKDQRSVLTLNVGVGDVAALSADGSTLVCVEFSMDRLGRPDGLYHFRFHDVYSNEPWLWAIATPAGLAMAWLLWRTWRTRRGRRSNATTPAATVGPGPSRGEPAA